MAVYILEWSDRQILQKGFIFDTENINSDLPIGFFTTFLIINSIFFSSIDAWLNPVDRLQEFASICMSTYHRRVGAVMASLMAESLDVAAENFLKPTVIIKNFPLYDIKEIYIPTSQFFFFRDTIK